AFKANMRMGTKRESMASMKPDEGDVLAPPQSNLGLGEDDPIDDDVKEVDGNVYRHES
ncbi:unnamed protein product, partial [Ilex paraguariensis]